MKKDRPFINKANNSSMGVPHARQRMMQYFQLSLIALVFVIVFGVIYFIAMKRDQSNAIDYSGTQLIQYDLPADDAPVVVYETDAGTFKAVLYPEQAPKYCEQFTSLVKSGYYDGTQIFAVQDGVYFMGGSKSSDGTDTDDTDKSELAPEKHRDLWPFYGAIAAYGNRTSLFNSQIKSGSRCLFIGSVEFTDEFKAQLDSASDNTALNEAFKTKGGVPNFAQQYTIFAQVYDGLDAYDKVLHTEVVKPAEDGEDRDADLRPKAGLKFNKVYLSTYGENRHDEFFTGSGTASEESSAQESSAAE